MKNSLLAGSGEIRSRGCFFVGRVAESQLIGAGQPAESSGDDWRRSHLAATGGAFISIVYNSWNKDEIPHNQAAQRGCSSQKCLL